METTLTPEGKKVIMKWFDRLFDSSTIDECRDLVEDLYVLGLSKEAKALGEEMLDAAQNAIEADRDYRQSQGYTA